MEMDVKQLSTKEIFDYQGKKLFYVVPKYQREYSWSSNDWEKLLQDIDENEPGYFLGSFIVVEKYSSAIDHKVFELIDGQQRIATITILFMVLFRKFMNLRPIDDSDQSMYTYSTNIQNLRTKFINNIEKGDNSLRKYLELGGESYSINFSPSTQNNNLSDYFYILEKIGLADGLKKPKYFGNRIIAKTYRHFDSELPSDRENLKYWIDKLLRLQFVRILVDSHADAFTLFETLNNRGVPLTAIDIIKNKVMGEIENKFPDSIDRTYDRWQDFLNFIPNYQDQVRFFRHYYNAFKENNTIQIDKYSRATRSNIVNIYEILLEKNPQKIFKDLLRKAELYYNLLQPENSNFHNDIKIRLEDLNRIGAAPAFAFLLYIFEKKVVVTNVDALVEILDILVKYYVRRNVTDLPSTRHLDQINIDLISDTNSLISSGNDINGAFVREKLLNHRHKLATKNTFKEILNSNIYKTNDWMTRFLLIKLDQSFQSREYAPDFWKRNNSGQYLWTIEHIYPQGKNIPIEWVKMIANGDRNKAKEIQERAGHKLGNLTLSAYNSKLSNAKFERKQRKEEINSFGNTLQIGYKNGLNLNELEFNYNGELKSLSDADEWSENHINARTESMVQNLMNIYSFKDEN